MKEYIVSADIRTQEMMGLLSKYEIVRCRDCRYYTHSSWHRCDLRGIAHEVKSDGFCAWGERKGDG